LNLPKPAKPAEDGLFWIGRAPVRGSGRPAVALRSPARRGWRVVATARRASELDGLYAPDASSPNAIIPLQATTSADRLPIMPVVASGIGSGTWPDRTGLPQCRHLLPRRSRSLRELRSFTRRSQSISAGNYRVDCIGAILPRMNARKTGPIVVKGASVAGYSGLPKAAAYGATKAGLINMVECLKFDCDRAGVSASARQSGLYRDPATASNPFPMPFLMPVDAAGRRGPLDRMDQGAASAPSFHLWRFASILKLCGICPLRSISGLSAARPAPAPEAG